MGAFQQVQLSFDVFAPNSLSGLHMWLRRDGLSGLNDGDAIATWSDSSGNGNNATQATAGNKPTYKTNIVNGFPVVRFASSSAKYFSLPSFSSLTQGEIFIVVKIVADPPPDDAHSGLWNMSTDTLNTHYPWGGDSTIYDAWGTTARKTVGNPTPLLTSWRVYNVYSASASWAAQLDNATLATTGTNTVGFPASPTLGKSLGAFYLDGDVAEVVMYNAKLSTTNRTNVYNYLKSRFGL